MTETRTRFDIGDNLSKSTELFDDAAYVFSVGFVIVKIIYSIIFLMIVYIIFISVAGEKFYPSGSPTIMQRVSGMFK